MGDFNIGMWLQAVISICLSGLIVYKTVPLLIKIAYLKDLYDKPDGDRKVHTNYIPTLGGVALFLAITLSYSFSGLANNISWMPYLLGSLTGLFFCGLKDDLVGLSPLKKLVTEVILASSLLYFGGFQINSFGGVFGIEVIPFWLGFPVSIFTVIVIINSFNLIDGIDGLAGGIGAIASLVFGIGFTIAGNYDLAVLSFTVTFALIGYLLHNFHPANIFMGDTGSLVIGFLLATLAINFISLSEITEFNAKWGEVSPALTVAILALPLYDTLRSFTRRIRRGRSPFSADSDHIHHALLKMGWGQRRTVIYLYISAVSIILMALVSCKLNVNISLGFVILTTLLIFPTNGFKRRLANRLGVNLENFLKPQKKVDLYHHLNEAQVKTRNRSRKDLESI